jgi:cold shock CspA family protein
VQDVSTDHVTTGINFGSLRHQPPTPPTKHAEKRCQVAFGKVKSFNAQKAFGHITSKVSEKDVYVTATSSLAAWQSGQVGLQPQQQVTFVLMQKAKGPQAVEVQNVSSEELERVYVGSVKFWNAEKGWGIVTSPEAQKFGDVFLHTKDVEDGVEIFRQGVQVRFKVFENGDGLAQASNISLAFSQGDDCTSAAAAPAGFGLGLDVAVQAQQQEPLALEDLFAAEACMSQMD